MKAGKFYIIAGEASGDMHGANLVKALLDANPSLQIRAWGGDRMENAGAFVVKHYKDLAFMGFTEVLMNLQTILRNLRFCKENILAFGPDALILIDYPGFNLRIAEWAHEKGIRVFYYISPQIWAWKKNRVHKIRRTVDKMYVILPFEKEFYARYGVDVEFDGHPLLDEIEQYRRVAATEKEFREKNRLPDKPLIALLPGSRTQEISRMLPRMLEVIDDFQEYHFVMGAASSLTDDYYRSFIAGKAVTLVREQTYDLFNLAKAGLVTSGTATLEAALFGMPEVVCYRGGSISIAIARRVIKVKYISLANLIMDREIVKELIQDDLNRKNLAMELRKVLDPEHGVRLKENYRELRLKLGGPGASKKVALSMLKTQGLI